MMKLHLGNTPNNLLEDDFNNLADDTDGYSGSDLSVVVREALMEPLRQCQIATHFKKVNDSEGVNGYFYMPCKANDRKAEKKTLMDIGSEELKCPDVVLQDFQTIMGVVVVQLFHHQNWYDLKNGLHSLDPMDLGNNIF